MDKQQTIKKTKSSDGTLIGFDKRGAGKPIQPVDRGHLISPAELFWE